MNTRAKKIKMHVKQGDIVQLISGHQKGQIGKITKVIYTNSKVIVEGLNLKVKHLRPKEEKESGTIVTIEAPIHSSNVMLYSEKHKIKSRYHRNLDKDNQKIRILNKTGEII